MERPSRGSYISRECNLTVSIKVRDIAFFKRSYLSFLLHLPFNSTFIWPKCYQESSHTQWVVSCCSVLFFFFFFFFFPSSHPPIYLLEPREGALFFKMMEMHVSGDGDKIAILVFKFQIGFIEKICGYITRCFITVIVSPLHAHLLVSFEFFLRSIDHEWNTPSIWLKAV